MTSLLLLMRFALTALGSDSECTPSWYDPAVVQAAIEAERIESSEPHVDVRFVACHEDHALLETVTSSQSAPRQKFIRLESVPPARRLRTVILLAQGMLRRAQRRHSTGPEVASGSPKIAELGTKTIQQPLSVVRKKDSRARFFHTSAGARVLSSAASPFLLIRGGLGPKRNAGRVTWSASLGLGLAHSSPETGFTTYVAWLFAGFEPHLHHAIGAWSFSVGPSVELGALQAFGSSSTATSRGSATIATYAAGGSTIVRRSLGHSGVTIQLRTALGVSNAGERRDLTDNLGYGAVGTAFDASLGVLW